MTYEDDGFYGSEELRDAYYRAGRGGRGADPYPPLTAEQYEDLMGNQPDDLPPAVAYLERPDAHMARAARERAVVRLDNGRTGRLVYWPGLNSRGRRARVMMPGGAYCTVDADTLELVRDAGR